MQIRSTTQPTAHSTNRKAPELPKSSMAVHRAITGLQPRHRHETSGSSGASEVREAVPAAGTPLSQKPQVSVRGESGTRSRNHG
jgi:hypothetical protein